MTLSQLRKLTRKWQERLRLMDWTIWVRWATKGEHEDCWGVCLPANTTKEAVIIIQHPKYVPDLGPDSYRADVEVVILHEILHLYFAPLNHESGSWQEEIEEVIISHISQLLVALDRRDETMLNPQAPRWLSKVASFHARPVAKTDTAK